MRPTGTPAMEPRLWLNISFKNPSQARRSFCEVKENKNPSTLVRPDSGCGFGLRYSDQAINAKAFALLRRPAEPHPAASSACQEANE